MVALFTLAQASGELDPWHVVAEASTTVQLVLLLLVGMSLVCWFIIGAKALRVARARRMSERFFELFWARDQGPWGSQRLESVYAQVKKYSDSPVASIFRAGYVELARIMRAHGEPADTRNPRRVASQADLDNIERAVRRAALQELTAVETMVPFLATTGSTAPFIGLFGTVWGIMNTIYGISAAGTDIQQVLPDIAEALIATAVGLAAAIPAVMAYNYFLRRIRVLESDMDSFASDYLNIIRRHFLRS